MTPIVPRIAIFSKQVFNKDLLTTDNVEWMASRFEIHYFNSDIDVNILYNNKFSLVIVVENISFFPSLKDLRIPTILVSSQDDLTGDIIYNYYIDYSIGDYNPTISIFTPAHNTFEKFDRAYESIVKQSFSDWEWIILDDSATEDNYEYIKGKVGNDHRIKIYKSNRKDSFVGSTKRQAASLCNGTYLLEFDHDDELHDRALELCVAAFEKYPDAGFCYSNCAETFETGGYVNYGDGYGMGQGKHFKYWYSGKEYNGSDTPINASTVRHIVGVPNHLRCWRSDVYHQIHRHNNKLAVVDDYELLIRTFLYTKIVQIQEVLYIQYMNAGGNNTQEPRRKEIQRLVDRIQKHYDVALHNRIIELGGVDWMWNEQTQQADLNRLPPPELKRSNLAYVFKL